jgi:hypothetical protein
MNRVLYIATIAALSISATSCTKVIDVSVDKTEQKIVIEGNITDAAGPYTIRVTKTIDIDKNNNFPGVPGAVVTVNDNVGNTETLKETATGIYQTATLVGTPGRVYTLTVTVEGKTYTAQSAMPAKIPFDSLGLKDVQTFDGPKPFPVVFYRDPAGKGNYYRAVLNVNGKRDEELYVESDDFIDGKKREAVLFAPGQDDLNTGDNIVVEMQCIDKALYEYLVERAEVDGSADVATPSNPANNITNGALGYFGAHTTEVRSLIYP